MSDRDKIAKIIEATDEANGWSTSREMYGKYADAILDELVAIPRAQIPQATFDAKSTTDTWITHGASGPMSEPATAVPDAVTAWEMVYHWASIALNVELLETEDAQLAKRRDELAAEFTAVSTYGGQLPYTQKMIDRIIELEAAL